MPRLTVYSMSPKAEVVTRSKSSLKNWLLTAGIANASNGSPWTCCIVTPKGYANTFPGLKSSMTVFISWSWPGKPSTKCAVRSSARAPTLKGPCGPCAAIPGTWNPINSKLAPAWPASTSHWVELWRFGPHCKMFMKLPVGKDPNFSSVGADGQADLDWRPLKNWLKPFGSTGTELLVISNVASLKVRVHCQQFDVDSTICVYFARILTALRLVALLHRA